MSDDFDPPSAFDERLETERAKRRQRVWAAIERVAKEPDRDSVLEMLRLLERLSALSDVGVFVEIPHVFAWVWFRWKPQLSLSIVEMDKPARAQTVWNIDRDAMEVLADLEENAYQEEVIGGRLDELLGSNIFRTLADTAAVGAAAKLGPPVSDTRQINRVPMDLRPILSLSGQTWAVTRYGLECTRLRYPIDAARLHEDDWIDHMSEKTWVDRDDFVHALDTARFIHSVAAAFRDDALDTEAPHTPMDERAKQPDETRPSGLDITVSSAIQESSRHNPWDPRLRPDVAILIALPEEFRSLAAEYARQWHSQRNPDHPGSDFLFVGPGGYRCVATIMPHMGPTVASQTSMRLLAMRPAAIINVGIAGGFKDDLRIGDVIVPRQVDAYDETGKIKGVRWERRGSDYRPSSDLLADVLELEFTSHEAHARWVDSGAAQLAKLRAGADQAPVDELLQRKLLRDKPTISTNHLASGSFVVASKPFAEFIREANADIHAGEMEAAGMMAAAEYQRRNVSTLVVRGISDHVDAEKEKVDAIGEGALRRLAMANAWRLVCTLMELGLLPRTEQPSELAPLSGENPPMQAPPREEEEVSDERLTEELAKVIWEPERARAVALAAGFRSGSIPVLKLPETFWAGLIEDARNGAIRGRVQAVADAATRAFPDNPIFRRYRGV